MPVWLEQLDHHLFVVLNQCCTTPWLDACMWLVSVLANGGSLLPLTAAGFWWFDRRALRRHVPWLLGAVLLGGLLVQAVKHTYARPRPLKAFAARIEAGEMQINVVGQPLRHRAFPSGHAQAVAAVSAYLMFLYPHRLLWWLAGMILAACSRVYVGVHFPADVMAGILIGAGSAAVVWRLRIMLQRQRGRKCSGPATPAPPPPP